MRLLAAAFALSLLALARPAFAQVAEAKVIPPEWPAETTFEFAIMGPGGERQATAYYRILQAESEGREVYWLKYLGRNEQLSEASECWVHRDTLLPLRSTRKVIGGGRTFYQDVAYGQGVIVVREKYEGQEAIEFEVPAGVPHFDYEELIWLIPQLDFGGLTQARFNMYATVNKAQASVVVVDVGYQPLVIGDHTYEGHLYGFDINMTPYKFWTVKQDGRPVTAKIEMGSTTFLNLRLDPKKGTTGQPKAKPKEEKPKEEPKQEDPGANPLGPPPPGGKY